MQQQLPTPKKRQAGDVGEVISHTPPIQPTTNLPTTHDISSPDDDCRPTVSVDRSRCRPTETPRLHTQAPGSPLVDPCPAYRPTETAPPGTPPAVSPLVGSSPTHGTVAGDGPQPSHRVRIPSPPTPSRSFSPNV